MEPKWRKNTEVYPSPIEAFCRGNFIIDCVVTFDQMFDCIIHMQSSIVNVDVLVSLTELFQLLLKYILCKQEQLNTKFGPKKIDRLKLLKTRRR